MADTMKLKVGDIVRLRSGGPKMTVTSTAHAQAIECSWFNEGKLEEGQFPTASLELVGDDD